MSDPIVEKAFLAVMNASDRQLALPLAAFAERNLLMRRLTVALQGVGHHELQDEVIALRTALGNIIEAWADEDHHALIEATEQAYQQMVKDAALRVERGLS